jgi:hypothetical protein
VTSLPRLPAAIAAGLATAAAITVITGVPVPQAAARPASPAVAAPAAVQALTAPTSSRAQALTLLDGSRLAVTANLAGASSGQVVSAAPAGRRGGLVAVSRGGTSYEIPGYAVAYLGRGIDPRLFSVTALARAERGGRIPVTVTYRGPVPVLPGVTITRAAGGTAAGYLTASSAKAFGAALARQSAADTARGSFGTDGLFGDGVSLRLAGSPAGAARSAQPGTGEVLLGTPAPAERTAGVHTLTFRADDFTGQPANSGTVFLLNVDNSDLLLAASTFSRGTAAFTVPDGHYFAAAVFVDAVGDLIVGERLTVLPQITVSADMTVRADALAATSKLTMVTPRPAISRLGSIVLRRVPASGPPAFFELDTNTPPMRVSPTTTPPRTGKLQLFATQTLYSPPSANPPYRYNLFYEDLSGIIGSQRYQVRPASLATVHARYGSAVPMNGIVFRVGGDPRFQVGSPNTLVPIRLPAQVTEYFTASPSVVWSASVYQFFPSGGLLLQQIDQRSYRAGARITENWNGYPLHAAPFTRVLGAAAFFPLLPSATRAGNTLFLLIIPFSDNTPGHLGIGVDAEEGSTGRFTIDQNGKQIAGGNANSPFFTQFLHATLSPRPSVIRLTLDASRDRSLAAFYPLGARSHTVWTWRSAPAPRATLPRGWTCPSIFVTGLRDRNCAAQPLLSLYYHVAGISIGGTVRAGRQSVTVLVSHFQPSASAARITHVTVRVSYDNGRIWYAAAVRRTAAGSFTARYTAPAWARFVTLNVTAADAAGSTVSEELPRAYQIIR